MLRILCDLWFVLLLFVLFLICGLGWYGDLRMVFCEWVIRLCVEGGRERG